jgi:hypothetical protein
VLLKNKIRKYFKKKNMKKKKRPFEKFTNKAHANKMIKLFIIFLKEKI